MRLEVYYRLSKTKQLFNRIPVIGKYIMPYAPSFTKKYNLYGYSVNRDFRKRKNGKVLIVGLPKSGNKWLCFLLSDYFNLEIIGPWKDVGKTALTMTHDNLFPMTAFRKDFISVVYIIRDIRDIIVSYYYFSQTDYYKRLHPHCVFDDIETFYFEYFLSYKTLFYNWLNHAEEYVSSGVPLIKYEMLWDDPVSELRRLFTRWRIDFDEDKAKQVVKDNMICRLKESGKKDMPKTHFRKGGYGGFKEGLPKIVLDDVNERFGGYLKRWGYLES